ncbi:nitrite reductase small subunit NirD [Aurantimonas sp. A3-2-R12]|uniref:nitrite reductase small subunit NirD n=1 Tax=Aurantimonas sp. A3-2-R12 TaxID=3114362 RepID=UPI002E16D0DA|nr:nitrite reductase small subunit NirD [Aurantimonas sp. A3-2-R12]
MNGETFFAIGTINDIPRRGARCVLTPVGRIAVFRTADDQVFATEDRCPHKGGPLSQGIVHDASVTCPLHNAVISLKDGEMRGPDDGKVRTFAVRIEPLTKVLELSLSPIAAAFADAAE